MVLTCHVLINCRRSKMSASQDQILQNNDILGTVAKYFLHFAIYEEIVLNFCAPVIEFMLTILFIK